MQKYKIATADNAMDLEREVNGLLVEGYRPLGAAFAFNGRLAQTLYRGPL